MATRAARRRARAARVASVHVNGNGSRPVSEIVGRTAPPQTRGIYTSRRGGGKTVDQTKTDYAFYDNLRRGKHAGYKLASLFCLRIERVLAAWIFGEGVTVTLNQDLAAGFDAARVDETNRQLQNFVGSLLDSGTATNANDNPDVETSAAASLPEMFKNAAGLGDQYSFVNSDGTLSLPSPDTVEITRDKLDYRHVLAVTITTILDEATITDEYRADGRTVTIEYIENGQHITEVDEYSNLLGYIPYVHVAYGRSLNETNGHSIHEALLPLYDQYDDVMEKMLDGVKLLGNPMLMFVGLENLADVIDLNAPQDEATYVDAGGNEVVRPRINLDRNSVIAAGKGADGKFVAPPVGFTEDAKTALNVLFWLLFEHLGVPESVWGGELSSARATADTQLVQFVKELRGWQQAQGGWIAKLCKIWLDYQALLDPQLVVTPLTVKWPDALQEDRALLLKFLEFVTNRGLITAETALKLTNLVEDASAEAKKGQAEADVQADANMARQQALAATTLSGVQP